MFLDSFARQQITSLEIHVKYDGRSDRQIFSTGALQRFLAGNIMLKSLTFNNMWIDENACGILGGIPQNLDSLELTECHLRSAQQLANGIGANAFGPARLDIRDCEVESISVISHRFLYRTYSIRI
jgi:hypothetical protein